MAHKMQVAASAASEPVRGAALAGWADPRSGQRGYLAAALMGSETGN